MRNHLTHLSILGLALVLLAWLLGIYIMTEVPSWPLFMLLESLAVLVIAGYLIWQWAWTLMPEVFAARMAPVNRILHVVVGWLALLTLLLVCVGFLIAPKTIEQEESNALARIVLQRLFDADLKKGDIVYVQSWRPQEVADLQALMPDLEFRDWRHPDNASNCGEPEAQDVVRTAITACLPGEITLKVRDAKYISWHLAEAEWENPWCTESVILANTPWGWHDIGRGKALCATVRK